MGTSLINPSREKLDELESFLGEEHCCAANSVQAAVQACLELLGTRSSIVPVIMPVTAPPDTLAAALRAGGHPLLLDIDEETLQMDADQLADAIAVLLTEDNTPIVLFTRPFGAPVSDELLDIVADLPSILDSRIPPSPNLEEEDLTCVFNIFDMTTMCGAGAVIFHKFRAQVLQLRQVISGPMGLGATLPETLAEAALRRLKFSYMNERSYEKWLDKVKDIAELCGPSKHPNLLWFKVPDAQELGLALKEHDIESALGVVPLFLLEEVKRRYAETPEYPVATKLFNNYLCVSAHSGGKLKALELL